MLWVRKPSYIFGGAWGLKSSSSTRSQHQARESPVSGKQPRPLKRQKPGKAAEAGTAGPEKPRASSIHGSGEPAPPLTRKEREKVGNSRQSARRGGGAGPSCSSWAVLQQLGVAPGRGGGASGISVGRGRGQAFPPRPPRCASVCPPVATELAVPVHCPRAVSVCTQVLSAGWNL